MEIIKNFKMKELHNKK